MNLISWYGLAGNALWICGLAVLLATLSMVRFEARAAGDRPRHRLGGREPRMAIAVGLILFCAGLLFSSDAWWQRVIWGMCAPLAMVWLVRVWGRFGAEGGDGT